MNRSNSLVISSAALSVGAAIASGLYYVRWKYATRPGSPETESDTITVDLSGIAEKLPPSLETWGDAGNTTIAGRKPWCTLSPVFLNKGHIPWPYHFGMTQHSPEIDWPSADGYARVAPARGDLYGDENGQAGRELVNFRNLSPLIHAVRTKEGRDVVFRVVVIREQGRNHLDILKKIATAPSIFLSNNHTLPMVGEFIFEHITFAIFPKVGFPLDKFYGTWTKNSSGDILNIIMQALEGLAFIHNENIAHCDAFKSNFVVDFYPESLLANHPAVTPPRVYLIDFETAVEFPANTLLSERVLTGLPLRGHLTAAKYYRPLIPEMLDGTPYDPFKVDVWQLGYGFRDFKSTIDAIDVILEEMRSEDPSKRMTANEALDKLDTVMNSTSPASLLVPPVMIPYYLLDEPLRLNH